MRVMIVTHYYPEHRGGIELVAGQIAAALVGRGVDVVWAASGPAPAASLSGITYLPMHAWNFVERLTGFAYPLWDPLSLTRLCVALRGCDTLHLHESLYQGNLVAFLAARLLRKDVVVTQHMGPIPHSRDTPRLQRLLRLVLAGTNRTVTSRVLGSSRRCIFISAAVRDYYASFTKFLDEPATIYNGVDMTIFRPAEEDDRRGLRSRLGWPEDRFVALFVGRFVAKKGLETVRWLAAGLPAVRWIFIGWGREDPLRWGLENICCQGILDHSTLADYYRAADLLVLPSIIEGFPLVVQEAMACGTPALITDLVAQGVPGVERAAFVCEPDRHQMQALLSEIVGSPELCNDRRTAAVAFARTNWDAAVNLAEHVDQILGCQKS